MEKGDMLQQVIFQDDYMSEIWMLITKEFRETLQ